MTRVAAKDESLRDWLAQSAKASTLRSRVWRMVLGPSRCQRGAPYGVDGSAAAGADASFQIEEHDITVRAFVDHRPNNYDPSCEDEAMHRAVDHLNDKMAAAESRVFVGSLL